MKILIVGLVFIVIFGFFLYGAKRGGFGGGSREVASASDSTTNSSRGQKINSATQANGESVTEQQTQSVVAQNTFSPLNPASRAKVLGILENKYKTHLNVTSNSAGYNAGIPHRLSGTVNYEKEEGENNFAMIQRFLNEFAPVLAIDHPEQLESGETQMATLGQITVFRQSYGGVPVDGALIRVHQDSQGSIFMVNSSYMPNVSSVDVTELFSSDKATQLVKDDIAKDATGDPSQAAKISAPLKVIHQFREGGVVAACWKITVSQPWIGAKGSGIYFINIRSGVFERLPGAVE